MAQVERVTSLCVISNTSGSFGAENEPPKCSIVVGAVRKAPESSGEPCLVVYDVVWKKTVGPILSENGPRSSASGGFPGTSASSSSGGGTIVKKGGTTKKITPAPHMMTPNFSAGYDEFSDRIMETRLKMLIIRFQGC